ncbi:hypothetical protein ACFLU4_03510 [Chloroflexota bacterium]
MKRAIIFFCLLFTVMTGAVSCTTVSEEPYRFDYDTYMALAKQMDLAADGNEYYAKYYQNVLQEVTALFHSLDKQQQERMLKLVHDLEEGLEDGERHSRYFESVLKESAEHPSRLTQPQYDALIRLIKAYQENAARYRNMADQYRSEAAGKKN